MDRGKMGKSRLGIKKVQTATKVHDRKSDDLPINSRVAIAIVDDPYSAIGEKIEVVRSVRDDPLAGMKARGQIDDAQYLAGRKWQEYHERCTIGGVKAIDPTKEAVDGGQMREPITQHQVVAFRQIFLGDKELGASGATIIRRVLAQRWSIARMAQEVGAKTEPEVKYVGRRFRECLDTLAFLWGFAQRP